MREAIHQITHLAWILLFIPWLAAGCQPTLQPTLMNGLDQPMNTGLTATAAQQIVEYSKTDSPATREVNASRQPEPSASPTLAQTLTPGDPAATATSPEKPPLTTLLFTGVIVPARCVQAAIDQRGEADYIYDEVRYLIQEADLALGTLNATLSDYPPHTGCVVTFVLVGDARSAGALARAGFDAMSVATNHIKNCGIGDCGDRAFFETLENLRQSGIQPVGAGANQAEAMQPVLFTLNGVRFGIVSLGQVEPMAFAGVDTPGIAELNEENLRQAIQDARQVADVVIAMPHWGPEDSPDPNHWQLGFARIAVEAGANLVVGNHTHVVQAVQELDGVQVFYGLGNFVFDQTWARDHQQGVILKVMFEGARYVGYEFIPTVVEGDGTVHLAGEDEAAEILKRIERASAKLK